MKLILKLFYFSFLLFFSGTIVAQNKVNSEPFKTEISAYEDKQGIMDINKVIEQPFEIIKDKTLNYGLSKSVFWFKIKFINLNKKGTCYLKIHNGTITNATLYNIDSNVIISQSSGTSVPYKDKIYQSQYPIFKIKTVTDSPSVYYLKVSSNSVLDLPITVGTWVHIFESVSNDQLFFGVYFGIILVMVFYNIFIYFTVRDKNYLYYVLYIISVGFLQSCLKGYASKYLWSQNTWLTEQAPNIAIALSGIFSIFFVFNFLNVKKYTPKIYIMLWGFEVIYFICICINLSNNYILAQKLLQGIAGMVAIIIMTCGIIIYKKGYKPALFFNVSWFFFLSSVIIYILKDAGVLPFNNFTSNSILIGSGFEVSLLSFALADKINTYRKEREESQLEAQAALQENIRIVREQNVILDQKVNERTYELKLSNTELNKALIDLKEAESQLVESEKMASLGQLTAGIAHEINNPINFVTSNVKPLNRDVRILLDTFAAIEDLVLDDSLAIDKQRKIQEIKTNIDYDYLKIEIDQLLSGITDGAKRTAEIVKGLRIFSRLDEDDLKRADINEGLESTLVIINNLLNNSIKVEKKYGNLPLIECYPGKLNQVFLNIISNAIYAVKKKFMDQAGGVITIKSYFNEGFVYISISDNGIGMDENTRKRLFEPFFTTKDVGEGTGLGLSIAYNTINKHNGQIIVNSEQGIGTEFILKLPLIHN